MNYLEVDYKNPAVKKIIESLKESEIIIYNGIRFYKEVKDKDMITGKENNIHFWSEYIDRSTRKKMKRYITVQMLFTWAYCNKRKLLAETKHGNIEIYNPRA